MKAPYTTSSKSKTFPKRSDYADLIAFIDNQIETEDREVPSGGAPKCFTFTEALDIKTETVHKYIITITKIEEKPN